MRNTAELHLQLRQEPWPGVSGGWGIVLGARRLRVRSMFPSHINVPPSVSPSSSLSKINDRIRGEDFFLS